MIKAFRCNYCKNCNEILSENDQKLGFCQKCLPESYQKLKRRILLSAVSGILLAAALVGIYFYVRETAYVSDVYGYEGDIFVPVFWGHLAFNARAFHRIMNYPAGINALILLFFFCIPFSSYVKIEYKTHRHSAEQELYQIGGFSGRMAAETNQQRMDDVGLFIASVLISSISGPFFLLYRFFRLKQFSDHLSQNNIQAK